MTDETADHGKRLRDLEAFAFRTRGALAAHGELLATTGERQHTTPGGIDSNVTDAPTDHRAIEQRLGTIERVLFALARAQGIDPAAD
jgi:hypothetical protein